MQDNIVGLKTITGVEIIGILLNESDYTYDLEKALFWDLVEVSPGKYDVQFFALTNGGKIDSNATHNAIDVKINKSSVMFCYEMREEVVAKYKQFTTPILLLNK